MARRKADVVARQQGLRGRLIVATEAELEKLRDADSDLYDFSGERASIRARLKGLRAGARVQFRRWGDGVPGDVWPERSVRLCWLIGDELVPCDDEIQPLTAHPTAPSPASKSSAGSAISER